MATFRKAGLDACPIPTDWHRPAIDPATAWIPDVPTLFTSYLAGRELAGIAAYFAMGRL
jgi:hypothetical protein